MEDFGARRGENVIDKEFLCSSLQLTLCGTYSERENGLSQLLRLLFSLVNPHLRAAPHLTQLPLKKEYKASIIQGVHHRDHRFKYVSTGTAHPQARQAAAQGPEPEKGPQRLTILTPIVATQNVQKYAFGSWKTALLRFKNVVRTTAVKTSV